MQKLAQKIRWKATIASSIIKRKLFGAAVGKAAGQEIKIPLLKSLAREHGIRTFIETGTYLGATTEALAGSFDTVYSIELDQQLFEQARKKFAAQPHIRIIQGDSGRVLGELLPTISEPCLFFLDGHYSGSATALGDDTTPIFRELECIFQNSDSKHVIVIDDARLFIGQDGYPTLKKLRAFVAKKNPALALESKDDLIRIYAAPQKKNIKP